MGMKQDKLSCAVADNDNSERNGLSSNEETDSTTRENDKGRATSNSGAEHANDELANSSDEDTNDRGEENGLYFHLLLKSTVEDTVKKGKITFSCYPKTGLQFKREVESQYKVPVCVQALSFQTNRICDSTRLRALKIQEGDTIEVLYTAEAEIEYLSSFINTLTRIVSLLRTILPELLDGAEITSDMHDLLLNDCYAFSQDPSHIDYFSVFPMGSPNANQLYFIHNGGLSLLLDMYELLHLLPWHQLPIEVQELEYASIRIIWNFSATLGIRRLLMHRGVLERIFLSLLRAKVEPFKQVAIKETLADPFGTPRYSTYVLAETIYAAIVAIGK